MEAMGCPETSVNYQATLRNVPEEGKSRLHGGISLESRNKHSESNNFTVTLMCIWHVGGRWYKPHFHIIVILI